MLILSKYEKNFPRECEFTMQGSNFCDSPCTCCYLKLCFFECTVYSSYGQRESIAK